MDKYDKVILACNNDECLIEYIHLLIRSKGNPAIRLLSTFPSWCVSDILVTNNYMDCPECGESLFVCEIIDEAGDL